MKIKYVLAFILPILITMKGITQVTRELQDAINQVPVARFAYPADRDRSDPPEVESPRAYAYAYYNLPYAIDLSVTYDDLTDGYLSKVIVKFKSINLSSGEEIRMLKNAITELQDLLDQQYTNARHAGFNARTNFTRSMIARFESNGRAIIAIREILSPRDLIDKLVRRMKSIS